MYHEHFIYLHDNAYFSVGMRLTLAKWQAHI